MRALGFIVLAACGVNQTPQPEPVPQLPGCIPDRDGEITAAELPIALGATVAYYEGTNRSVDLAAGGGIWDLADEHPDDDVVALGPIALETQWFAGSFPAGQFAVDAGDGLVGIYHQDTQALWLDGTASVAESPKTFVRYTEPVAILRFPIRDGAAYETVAEISDGVIQNLPFVGSDRVAVDITGSGRLDVPYVRFSPVLRARTHVVRTPSTGSPVVGRRATIFLFECFGEVARAESKQDETNADFTTAARLRRFALGVTP
jgi:hypothetical protein